MILPHNLICNVRHTFQTNKNDIIYNLYLISLAIHPAFLLKNTRESINNKNALFFTIHCLNMETRPTSLFYILFYPGKSISDQIKFDFL